jgi:DNA topoisomerase-2
MGLFLPKERFYIALLKRIWSKKLVNQFIGYISEETAYHHGEKSLAKTIIRMAQNFVGKNNINLLKLIGQYGTRNLVS